MERLGIHVPEIEHGVRKILARDITEDARKEHADLPANIERGDGAKKAGRRPMKQASAKQPEKQAGHPGAERRAALAYQREKKRREREREREEAARQMQHERRQTSVDKAQSKRPLPRNTSATQPI